MIAAVPALTAFLNEHSTVLTITVLAAIAFVWTVYAEHEGGDDA